jgi:hypothetical protein
MVLTVSFVLSPVTGLFATVALRIAQQDLTPASGRQDHTTSPSAAPAFAKASAGEARQITGKGGFTSFVHALTRA